VICPNRRKLASLGMKHHQGWNSDNKMDIAQKNVPYTTLQTWIVGFANLGPMSIGKRKMMESGDRVRHNTSEDLNREVDRQIAVRVRGYAMGKSEEEISNRIRELDCEWDVERVLQTNASVIGLTGLILGVTANKRWLVLPGVVLPFLLQHAVQGWCPPVPLFRRMGYRTRQEIDREKYALKVIRGDFEANRELRDDVAALRSVDLGQ
jgi:hypothetical protein